MSLSRSSMLHGLDSWFMALCVCVCVCICICVCVYVCLCFSFLLILMAELIIISCSALFRLCVYWNSSDTFNNTSNYNHSWACWLNWTNTNKYLCLSALICFVLLHFSLSNTSSVFLQCLYLYLSRNYLCLRFVLSHFLNVVEIFQIWG